MPPLRTVLQALADKYTRRHGHRLHVAPTAGRGNGLFASVDLAGDQIVAHCFVSPHSPLARCPDAHMYAYAKYERHRIAFPTRDNLYTQATVLLDDGSVSLPLSAFSNEPEGTGTPAAKSPNAVLDEMSIQRVGDYWVSSEVEVDGMADEVYLMVLRLVAPVADGEEICVDYGNEYDRSKYFKKTADATGTLKRPRGRPPADSVWDPKRGYVKRNPAKPKRKRRRKSEAAPTPEQQCLVYQNRTFGRAACSCPDAKLDGTSKGMAFHRACVHATVDHIAGEAYPASQ